MESCNENLGIKREEVMYQYKMKLTDEQKAILEGKEGEVKAKVMETIVRYGDMFEATELVKVTHGQGHLVTSFGLKLLKPVYRVMDELIAAGLKVEEGFTMDPRPNDFANVKYNLLDKILFKTALYGKQKYYEDQLTKLGLVRQDGFSCACYFDEMGNNHFDTHKEQDDGNAVFEIRKFARHTG